MTDRVNRGLVSQSMLYLLANREIARQPNCIARYFLCQKINNLYINTQKSQIQRDIKCYYCNIIFGQSYFCQQSLHSLEDIFCTWNSTKPLSINKLTQKYIKKVNHLVTDPDIYIDTEFYKIRDLADHPKCY
jgi:hypothetical protein